MTEVSIAVRVPDDGRAAALVTIQRARLHLLARQGHCISCGFSSTGDRIAILLLSFMEAVLGAGV